MANTVILSTSDSNMDDYPLWMQAAGGDPAINYAGTLDRGLLDGLFTAEGVLGAAAFKVTQRGAGANFSVDVAAGQLCIAGDDGANQGKYVCRSLGTVNVATPLAPGSGTRVHRIIARIRDKQVIGSGTYDWTLELLEDTGSGTPAQPNSAITLALVSIAVGQASVLNANITDQRPQAQLYNSAGLIQETVLSAAAATVTFQNIPQTYRHLMVVCLAKSSDAAVVNADVKIKMNNDGGNNYSYMNMYNNQGFTVPAVTTANTSAIALAYLVPGSNVNANIFGGGFLYLLGYSSTVSVAKDYFAPSGSMDFGAVGTSVWRSGSWCPQSFTPAAITRLDFSLSSGNFVANSYFAIYGYGS